MNLYPSWELQQELYVESRDYLIQFPWRFHATLTFPEGYNFFPAISLLERWLNKIRRHENSQIAACRISSYRKNHFHFHVLLLGLNGEGEQYEKRFIRKWEKKWAYIARIRQIRDNYRVCDYVAKHYLGCRSDYAEIDFYNEELLSQLSNHYSPKIRESIS